MYSQYITPEESIYYLDPGITLLEQHTRFSQAISLAPHVALYMCITETPAARYFSGLPVTENYFSHQLPFEHTIETFKLLTKYPDNRVAMAILNLNPKIGAYFKTDFQNPEITVQRFIECVELCLPELIANLWTDSRLHAAINQASIERITELFMMVQVIDGQFLQDFFEKISKHNLEQIVAHSTTSDDLKAMINRRFSDNNNNKANVANSPMQANMKLFSNNNNQNSDNLRNTFPSDRDLQLHLIHLLDHFLSNPSLYFKLENKPYIDLISEINSLLNELNKNGIKFDWIECKPDDQSMAIDQNGYELWVSSFLAANSNTPSRTL